MNLLALAVILAQTVATSPAPAPAPAATTAKPAAVKAAATDPAMRKLSKRERKDRVSKLDARFQDFLDDVEPIILPVEVDTFLYLETEVQRDSFVEEFWRRRDAMQGTSGGTFRKMYYSRLDAVRQQIKHPNSDRARMFLLHGAPAEVVRAECLNVIQPLEIWKYETLPGVPQGVWILFFKPRGAADYRIWNPLGGSNAIGELMSQDPLSIGADEATARRAQGQSQSPYAWVNRIQIECREGDLIMRAITSMIQSRIDLLKLFQPPGAGDEDSNKLLRSLVVQNPNAPKLTAEFSVKYPGKDGSRTDVQMTLLVPRAQLTPSVVGTAEVYTVDVVGEIVRNGNLWEKYRYRFDFPGDIDVETLPIVIDRFLRPDDYIARIKIADVTSGAEALVESPLEVPEVFVPILIEPEREEAIPQMQNVTVASLKKDLDPNEVRLKIIPPQASDIVSGVRSVDTISTGEAIKAVEFWLDGRKIAVRRAPPFALDFDFGIVPTQRRIRAVALDAAGKPITGDEIVVNGGTDPFRARIVSPRVAPSVSGPLKVEVDVRVPHGEELDGVEIYWNEMRVATLYDPPFVQTITTPEGGGAAYLRAVAKLKNDAIPPVEDVVMINTPSFMEELNVHLIELPTTVVIDGKPSGKLTEKAFQVFDEGKQVPLAKFEYVTNLPLSLGLAMDTSGSMVPRMEEAQKAGAQFAEKVMRRGDKAFLVSFDATPQLVQGWSTKVADIHAGLARLRAERTTALYDAVVFALYNFQGIQGQKALVVISDGKDTSSKFSWEHAFEYARRAGVPIYAIGIGISGPDVDVRYRLQRLCTETGGSVYYIEQARDLQRVYDAIQNELRSQYVLGFYPAADVRSGGKWREVNVQVSEGKARTVKGYFP